MRRHNIEREYEPEVEAEQQIERERRRLEDYTGSTDLRDVEAAAGPYKVQVIADSTRTWCGNGVKFSSPDDAERYARELMDRWTAVREWRVIDRAGTVVRGSGSDF